jgi:hypothetical protein
MNESPFSACDSLNRLCIPASVTAIHFKAFDGSRISSIEIEEGSVSFRVRNGFLVDFDGGSLLWVIGSPESILIPSSIGELGPFCCASKFKLRIVEFESDSNLRVIGKSAFAGCGVLESIQIPSSVEVLREGCFQSCWNLRTVAFGAESQLRLIEQAAFRSCQSLISVSVPARAEVLDRAPVRLVGRD